MKITEQRLVATSLAVVGLHLVEENYLLPAEGTSPLDHLASGLVPLAVLAAVAALYGRLRAGLRAGVAITVGAVAASTGFPAVYGMVGDGGGIDLSGLAALAGGLTLVAVGPVVLWRARRRGGSRRRRYLLRAGSAGVAVVAAPVLLMLVVFPIAFAYGYTHIGRTSSSQDQVALPHERVTIRTPDGIDLAAAYVPSRNGAAVVVFPGAAALKEGRMLARNGYGVLFLDPRGQGRSGGDNVRWAGDRDLIAAAEYLQGRPDVDDDRVAGFGSSVGGEILIEAAARSDAFAAVVSEGAGWRIGYADLDGVESVLFAPILASLTAATTVFSNHGAPPDIVDRIGLIAPRPVFLIHSDPGMGGESESQQDFYAAAGEPKDIWLVPGAEHTGGIDARPREYEQRVTAFLDRSLAR